MTSSDNWSIKSHTFANCNCAANCGCQFNLPSTHGYCEFVEAGHLVEGHYNDVSLAGLNWAFMIIWPREIAEGNGREQIVIDAQANADQREALCKIVSGEAGEAGSNHFSVFRSTCSEVYEPIFAPIELSVDIEARQAKLHVPGMIESHGNPIVNEFSGEPFHIALCRPSGSFEFTYAEIGSGKSSVTGEVAMELDGSYAQFCVHHYDQNGLITAA